MSTTPSSPGHAAENTGAPVPDQQDTVAEQADRICGPSETDRTGSRENTSPAASATDQIESPENTSPASSVTDQADHPEDAVPASSAKPELDYFGVSPDKLIELPGADSFKTAIEKLRLPELAQGKPFECVVRLFTINNGFDRRIQLYSAECYNRNDFKAELNAEKTLLHLKGVPSSAGEVSIRFRYTTKSAASLFFSGIAQNEYEYTKIIRVSPDPVLAWSRNFKEYLRTRQFSPKPQDGQAGIDYRQILNFRPEDVPLRKQITFLSAEILPDDCGITAKITDAAGDIEVFGHPVKEAVLTLNICYEYSFADKKIQETASIQPFAHIAPDVAYEYEKRFIQDCRSIVSKRSMAGTEVNFEFSLKTLIDTRFLEIPKQEFSDGHFSAEYDPENMVIKAQGVPASPGLVSFPLNYLVKTAGGNVERNISIPVLNVTPDPKTLWKNLPTDPAAPYQTKDMEWQFIEAGDRVIVAASKRGRSHAHEGKFRDDNFKAEYLAETGWSIVVVSDGAGSAKFSREGSRIACETFCGVMKTKLSSPEINAKLDGMAEDEREKALKNAVLSAAYQCISKIDAESRAQNNLRKDYNATFLAYIMKKYGDQWLIISMGIGDGIIGLIDREDHIQLLSEPDGGEFVGMTRFITMNEVWNDDPIKRVQAHKVSDFGIIMSMSDGVSDPKFETDNNLKKEEIWLNLRDEIVSQVPLSSRSEETAQKLCDWLDFWSKGNHDDRTIVLVY